MKILKMIVLCFTLTFLGCDAPGRIPQEINCPICNEPAKLFSIFSKKHAGYKCEGRHYTWRKWDGLGWELTESGK